MSCSLRGPNRLVGIRARIQSLRSAVQEGRFHGHEGRRGVKEEVKIDISRKNVIFIKNPPAKGETRESSKEGKHRQDERLNNKYPGIVIH